MSNSTINSNMCTTSFPPCLGLTLCVSDGSWVIPIVAKACTPAHASNLHPFPPPHHHMHPTLCQCICYRTVCLVRVNAMDGHANDARVDQHWFSAPKQTHNSKLMCKGGCCSSMGPCLDPLVPSTCHKVHSGNGKMAPHCSNHALANHFGGWKLDMVEPGSTSASRAPPPLGGFGNPDEVFKKVRATHQAPFNGCLLQLPKLAHIRLGGITGYVHPGDTKGEGWVKLQCSCLGQWRLGFPGRVTPRLGGCVSQQSSPASGPMHDSQHLQEPGIIMPFPSRQWSLGILHSMAKASTCSTCQGFTCILN